jgi:glutamyl-tRNA synthetase
MAVRTRVAPSPTGYPHIGTIYQAMFDFVFAKSNGGKFIVRIEDTDRTRFVEGAEQIIYDSLNWFGLESDEDPIKGGQYGPYKSSERLETYKKYVQELVDNSHAYYCFCTKERLDELRKKQEAQKKAPMYDKLCASLSWEQVEEKLKAKTPHVIRMKIPENQKLKVHDVLLGDVEFESNLIDDPIILKSDGFPTYHLAAMVDDYLMGITHVFRGQEWLPSYPKHQLLYQYLGWENKTPEFIHLPVILNAEGGGKLSKRHGHASVDYYRKEGYLPEAILNYLANIVWNHPNGKEIFPFMELSKAIPLGIDNKIKEVQIYSQGPKFDLKKLDWVNGEWIRKMSDEDLLNRVIDYLDYISEGKLADTKYEDKEKIAKLIPLVRERIKKLSDFIPLTDFIFEKPEYDSEVFNKLKIEKIQLKIEKVVEILEKMDKPWKAEIFEQTFRDLAKDLDISVTQMFQLLRVAVSGQTVTPPLFESIQVLGEDETLQRIQIASQFLKNL